MKIHQLWYCFVVLACFMACEPVTSEQTGQNPTTTTTTDTTQTSDRSPAEYRDSTAEKLAHNCTIEGSLLDGNQVWIKKANTLVALVADSTSLDPDLGESHRVLKIYNTENCNLIKTETLPINVSADYPYYLSELNSDDTSPIVGVRGFGKTYLYDINNQAVKELEPQFLANRMVDDAQSGMILSLQMWKNYMVGYAADNGVFVVDMTDAQNPKSMEAHAEFTLPDDTYSSLFLLPAEDNKYQALLPKYDFDNDDFQLNPLFKKNKDMNIQISKGAQNNRYIVLRENDAQKTGIAIDMQERKQLDLPNTVAIGKVKEILEWVKKKENI